MKGVAFSTFCVIAVIYFAVLTVTTMIDNSRLRAENARMFRECISQK